MKIRIVYFGVCVLILSYSNATCTRKYIPKTSVQLVKSDDQKKDQNILLTEIMSWAGNVPMKTKIFTMVQEEWIIKVSIGEKSNIAISIVKSENGEIVKTIAIDKPGTVQSIMKEKGHFFLEIKNMGAYSISLFAKKNEKSR